MPNRVGKTELAGFVLLPALLPLIFGGQWTARSSRRRPTSCLLPLIYAVVGYGLICDPALGDGPPRGPARAPRWGCSRRPSRCSLIFALLSFMTPEMWQIFPSMTTPIYFLIIGSSSSSAHFFWRSASREARHLEQEAGAEAPPLDRRQRFNVGLVMFVSQAVQVLIVSAALGAFFVAFGLLAINDDARPAGSGTPATSWCSSSCLASRSR